MTTPALPAPRGDNLRHWLRRLKIARRIVGRVDFWVSMASDDYPEKSCGEFGTVARLVDGYPCVSPIESVMLKKILLACRSSETLHAWKKYEYLVEDGLGCSYMPAHFWQNAVNLAKDSVESLYTVSLYRLQTTPRQ